MVASSLVMRVMRTLHVFHGKVGSKLFARSDLDSRYRKRCRIRQTDNSNHTARMQRQASDCESARSPIETDSPKRTC